MIREMITLIFLFIVVHRTVLEWIIISRIFAIAGEDDIILVTRNYLHLRCNVAVFLKVIFIFIHFLALHSSFLMVGPDRQARAVIAQQ